MTGTQRTAPAERFQVSTEAAEVYEARFVPAIFAEWAPLLLDVADVRPGQAVLDVACGTGIVARTAADRLGGNGLVAGLDLNEAMLAVARRVRPDLQWRQGDVAAMPFADSEFDAVLCQMALMFFPDRAAALREMARVARPGGVVAVCVPAALPDQPAYAPFVDMVVAHAGDDARPLLGTYWSCGDLDALRATLTDAGLTVVGTRTHLGTAAFDSPEALATTEIEGSPLAGRIAPQVYDRIRADAREVLRPFTARDGTVAAPLRGHLVAGRTPRT
ncbi:methyltransferase domain-containing protein [Geodermatophilus sp. SYSU D00703]